MAAPTNEIPDGLPEELVEQSACDLMNTIEGFCRQSNLTPRDIVGCLEGVKFSMLRKWFRDVDADVEITIEDDDEGEAWKGA